MHFYLDLCDVDDPILKLGEDGWFISRPVDLRNYVTPRWDESFQPPIYTKGRWRKVQTGARDLLRPVSPIRRSWRCGDATVNGTRSSLVGELVAEKVAAGKTRRPGPVQHRGGLRRAGPFA